MTNSFFHMKDCKQCRQARFAEDFLTDQSKNCKYCDDPEQREWPVKAAGA